MLKPWLRILNTYFTLNNYFFGSVELTKNANPDRFKCSDCIIGFDSRSFTDGSMRENVVIFGTNVSSSWHIDNKSKDILILAEGTTQGLYDATSIEEAKYPISFT